MKKKKKFNRNVRDVEGLVAVLTGQSGRLVELWKSIIQNEITLQRRDVNNLGYYDLKEPSAAYKMEWDCD